MGLVDTAVVGRLGAVPLGAVGLANGLFLAVAIVGLGTMLGLDPLFAQALGARDEPRARELIWQGLWLSALVTLALALPIAALPLALGPWGIPAEVAGDARLFLWLRLPGLWPMLAFAALRSYLQGRVQPGGAPGGDLPRELHLLRRGRGGNGGDGAGRMGHRRARHAGGAARRADGIRGRRGHHVRRRALLLAPARCPRANAVRSTRRHRGIGATARRLRRLPALRRNPGRGRRRAPRRRRHALRVSRQPRRALRC